MWSRSSIKKIMAASSLMYWLVTGGCGAIVLNAQAQTDSALAKKPVAFSRWSLGIEGALNKNYLISNVGYRNDTEYKAIGGYAYGVPVRYSIWSNLSILSGIGWGQKNYQWQRTGFFEGTYMRFRNSFVQVPLGVQFSTPILPHWPRLRVFAEGGVVAQYWLKKEAAYQLPSINNPLPENLYYTQYSVPNPTGSNVYDWFAPTTSADYKNMGVDTQTDRRWQWQWQLAAGLQYQLKNAFTLYAKVAVAEDLTDMQAPYQQLGSVAKHNRTYQGGFGALVNLSAFHAGTVGNAFKNFFGKAKKTNQ